MKLDSLFAYCLSNSASPPSGFVPTRLLRFSICSQQPRCSTRDELDIRAVLQHVHDLQLALRLRIVLYRDRLQLSRSGVQRRLFPPKEVRSVDKLRIVENRTGLAVMPIHFLEPARENTKGIFFGAGRHHDTCGGEVLRFESY